MKKLITLGIVGLILLLTFAFLSSAQYSTAFVSGKSPRGWTLHLQGSQGVFSAYGQTWNVEIIFDWLGQTGYAKTLWFVGRRPDNYLLGFAFVNYAGDSFVVWHYDYKNRRLEADRFQGSYDVGSLSIRPTAPMPGYVPVGIVPGYIGRDFRVNSAIAQVTAAEGRLTYLGTELAVYPIYNLEVGNEFSEFWALAYDAKTRHAYHVIFYSHQPNGWLVDLWSGTVNLLPLGQALVMGGPVQITRNVSLGN